MCVFVRKKSTDDIAIATAALMLCIWPCILNDSNEFEWMRWQWLCVTCVLCALDPIYPMSPSLRFSFVFLSYVSKMNVILSRQDSEKKKNPRMNHLTFSFLFFLVWWMWRAHTRPSALGWSESTRRRRELKEKRRYPVGYTQEALRTIDETDVIRSEFRRQFR